MLQKSAPPLQNTVSVRRIFIRALTVEAMIGAYDHEFGRAQPVVIDIELEVVEPEDPLSDSLEDVVCYNKLCAGVRAIIAEGHIRLVETLAERIAAHALAHPLTASARVRIEKPQALSDATAGVEIVRRKA